MPTFANTINNNEIYAKRAECDAVGSDIQQTYATKSAVSTGLSAKEDSANKAQTLDPTSTTDFPSSAATANYVNSSVATATANFLGNFTLTDLGLTYPATDSQIGTALDSYTWPAGVTPTNNDYTYIEIQDPQTTGLDDRVERFKFNGSAWVYEYTLNNSSFTSQEKAAIDSGIDSTKVTAYDAHVADSDIHVTLSDKSTWNAKQDAISDLATIRSGAAEGATAVQPSDLATVATTGSYDDLVNKPTIPAAQVNSDWNSNSGVSQILNKPTLATVATTGDYDDLSNKPSIPAAQVNSDWNAVSGVSEILNKPTIPSGSDLVPPYSLPTDEGKVLTVGPSTTYWSTPAPGGVTDVEVDGTSVVSQGVASITMPTVDQTYDGTSTNAQSGVAIAGELATINQVPASTSADSGKVLTVDSNGDPGWATGGGGTSYTAGYGIYIDPNDNNAISVDPDGNLGGISVTSQGVGAKYDGTTIDVNSNNELQVVNPLPASTSADSGKVLTVDSNGDPGWVTGGGGGGVQSDWTEADPTSMAYIENKPTPKTLTAGDGITITESSNALTVSSNYSETVLYYNANGVQMKNGITLSESRLNFEAIRLVVSLQAGTTVGYIDIPMMGANTGSSFSVQSSEIPYDSNATGFVICWKIYITATDTTLTSTNAIYWGKSSCDGTSTNPGTWTQGANVNVPYVYKVIGINRVANN